MILYRRRGRSGFAGGRGDRRWADVVIGNVPPTTATQFRDVSGPVQVLSQSLMRCMVHSPQEYRMKQSMTPGSCFRTALASATMMVIASCASPSLPQGMGIVGVFGGGRAQVTAEPQSLEVRHACISTSFDGPLIADSNGEFELTGTVTGSPVGMFTGAPAIVRGSLSEDHNEILFTRRGGRLSATRILIRSCRQSLGQDQGTHAPVSSTERTRLSVRQACLVSA